MLKTRKEGAVWMVSQPDHSQLAGYFAAHWGNGTFAKLGGFTTPVAVADPERLRDEAVLKAEYDAVYETLSERLATGVGPDAEIGEPSAEEMLEISERWRTYEGLSLQRSECTERARSAARRILGDELASRVQGLSPRKAGW